MWFHILLTLVFILLYKNVRRPYLYPPGPAFWPLIGNLITIWFKSKKLKYHHAIWQNWCSQYGEILGLRMGLTNVVVVSGKENIREVSSRDVFDGRPDGLFYRIRSFGKKNLGVVFAQGKSWNVTRNSLLKHLKNFGYGKQRTEELISDECKALVHFISENVNKPMIANNLFGVPIINILWRLMAGRRYNLNDRNMITLCNLIKESFLIADMTGGMLNFLPFLRYLMPNRCGYRQLVIIHNKIYEFIMDVIKEHEKNLDYNKPKDVIDYLLIEMVQNGDPFTEENIKVICLDMLEAGMETVGNTMDFLVLYLVLNENVQRRVQMEIDHVVGHNRLPILNDRQRMKYTEAFILEVLRMSSVAPVGIPHSAREDARLGSYIIPKGTLILLSLHALNNGKDWEHPELFRPERFLNHDGDLIQEDSFMPFGLGKRRCIGENLARSELFLFTVCLLQKFNISTPKGEPSPSASPNNGVTLSAKPFKVIFSHRI